MREKENVMMRRCERRCGRRCERMCDEEPMSRGGDVKISTGKDVNVNKCEG